MKTVRNLTVGLTEVSSIPSEIFLKAISKNIQYIVLMRACLTIVLVLTLCSVAVPADGQSLAAGRFTAYSTSFGKRFAIPEPQISMADGPLHAIEIIPTSTEPARSRWCEAKLYVDSALKIELPAPDQSGSEEPTNLGSHFFLADDVGSKRWQRLSETDRRHFGRHQMSGYQLAAVATPDYRPGGQGAFASTPYRSFLREMFPGITYLHIGVPCRWIADFESKYPAIQVWLKRSGAADYRDLRTRGEMDPKDFIKLDVPSELARKAKASMAAK